MILLLLTAYAFALGPSESFQLQQLINNSEREIQEAKKLVESSKQDAASAERAAQILDRLSSGLDRSIQQFKGTRAYEQALLEVQNQAAAERAKPSTTDARERQKKDSESFERFQRESLRANQNDLSDQEKLEQALVTAEPGFVPKLQTRAQLGSWQASTRTSAQLSELISAVRELREEMRGQKSEGLEGLLKGTQALSDQLRGVSNARR